MDCGSENFQGIGIAAHYIETAGHTLEEIAIAFGDKAFVDDDKEVIKEVELTDVHKIEHK